MPRATASARMAHASVDARSALPMMGGMKAAVFLVAVAVVGVPACQKAPEERPPTVAGVSSSDATPSSAEPALTASAEPAPTGTAAPTASAAVSPSEPTCEQYVRQNVELLFADLDEAGRASVFADAGEKISECDARRKVVSKEIWLGCANCIMSSDPSAGAPVYLERCAPPCDAFVSAAEKAGVK